MEVDSALNQPSASFKEAAIHGVTVRLHGERQIDGRCRVLRRFVAAEEPHLQQFDALEIASRNADRLPLGVSPRSPLGRPHATVPGAVSMARDVLMKESNQPLELQPSMRLTRCAPDRCCMIYQVARRRVLCQDTSGLTGFALRYTQSASAILNVFVPIIIEKYLFELEIPGNPLVSRRRIVQQCQRIQFLVECSSMLDSMTTEDEQESVLRTTSIEIELKIVCQARGARKTAARCLANIDRT
ncbi:hypothetical protein C8Q74DRAFT_563590 [Fomes fomentarius]|nr:hypothetical protein C8Q74DRAFT_563590 [Fomes fomentarius]